MFAALAHPGIDERRFVSKNVCHGVVYDRDLHRQVAAVADGSRSLTLIHQAMEIDPGIATWAEVEIYQVRDEWGSRGVPGAGTSIITGYDHDRFLATLLAR